MLSQERKSAIEQECYRLFNKWERFFSKGMPHVAWTTRKARKLGTYRPRTHTITFYEGSLAEGGTRNDLDVARHEMAHAANPGEKHSRKWRFAARAFGAVPRARRSNLLDYSKAPVVPPLNPLLVPRPWTPPGGYGTNVINSEHQVNG